MIRKAIPALLLVLSCLARNIAAADSPIDFDSQVRPLLERSCVKCHGADKQNGGLRFDGKAAAFVAGDSGAMAIAAGDVAASELVRRIESGDESERMPASADPLSPEEIALFKDWIAQGAVWPDDKVAAAPSEMRVTDLDREHWAFRRLSHPQPPASSGLTNDAWSAPIDRFLGAALAEKRIEPNGQADRRTLIRRLSFDLLGLPPAIEEVEAFVADERPDAYERLVDRYLASPHFGERWGRHWLDLARYADSNGMEGDADRPYAFPYRDFVIWALNEDLPFDTFARWQLAGDEYEPDNIRALAATGFLTAAPIEVLNVPMEEEKLRLRYNELDDMASTTAAAFLSLTLGCARCHDHKFDPIPTRDYYRLQCAFTTTRRDEIILAPSDEAAQHRLRLDEWAARRNEAKKNGADEAALKAIDAEKPRDIPFALAITETGATPEPTFLLRRGDFYARQEQLQLGFLSVLTLNRDSTDYWAKPKEQGDESSPSTGQRRALAEWITDLENGAGPLLARVIVNRLWQQHFGEGLVRTAGDFGMRSESPTHPELLEWLASELVVGQWRLKPLHRAIVTSAAYRQGNAFDEARAAIDPENRLLWRRRPLRLEAEALRDAILAASGELNERQFGPAFKPPIPAEAILARNVKGPYPKDIVDSPATQRRSVYMFHKRVTPYPFMQAFDRPDATVSCARRSITTVAPQALALLNDPFVRGRARDFANRLRGECDSSSAELVERAYQIALSRSPSEADRAASIAFLEQQSKRRDPASEGVHPDALVDFCQALFSLNEFAYVD